MKPAWIFTVGLFLLLAWSFRSAVAEMCKEEMRTRLGLLPYALIRLVRWPRTFTGLVMLL